MVSETTLLITASGRLGQETALQLRKHDVSGLLLAPASSQSVASQENLPEGWAHLKGDVFETETLLATARAAHHIIFICGGGDDTPREEMELISSLADTLEESNGTLLLVRETPFVTQPGTPDNRQGAMLRRTEEMLAERSLRANFKLAILSLPHMYGPGLEQKGLQERLAAAAQGNPYTWPGKPNEEPWLMHMKDGAKAIAASFHRARKGGERMWVSGDPEITMGGLSALIAEMTGGISKVSWPDVGFFETLKGTYRKPARPRTIGKILPGTEISEALGNRTTLGEGLRETLLSISVDP